MSSQQLTYRGAQGYGPEIHIPMVGIPQLLQVISWVSGNFQYVCSAPVGTPVYVEERKHRGWQIYREDVAGSYIGRIIFPVDDDAENDKVRNGFAFNIRSEEPINAGERITAENAYVEGLTYSFEDADVLSDQSSSSSSSSTEASLSSSSSSF